MWFVEWSLLFDVVWLCRSVSFAAASQLARWSGAFDVVGCVWSVCCPRCAFIGNRFVNGHTWRVFAIRVCSFCVSVKVELACVAVKSAAIRLLFGKCVMDCVDSDSLEEFVVSGLGTFCECETLDIESESCACCLVLASAELAVAAIEFRYWQPPCRLSVSLSVVLALMARRLF